jgi:hypothetical protein
LIAAVLTCEAAQANNEFPALNVYGADYPNACSKSEQLKLWKVISGKVRDVPVAKRALHAILCVLRTGPSEPIREALI